VTIATGTGLREEEITDAGLNYIKIPISRGGKNPFSELRLLFALFKIYRKLKPELVHLVTIKPVIYGGILSRLMSVKGVVIAISGMGYLFTRQRQGLVKKLVSWIYRFSLGHKNSRVIVQNRTDRKLLQDMGVLNEGQDVLIPGSGVNLREFVPKPLPEGIPLVILPARMLWDKGVKEFVEAAKILQADGVKARFALVGPADLDNPAAVTIEQLEVWKNEGPVEWWGYCADMPSVYAEASLVVLPSYREGMPKSLLDALASGRAIVTTDAPGCRDVVESEKNGKLVPVGDSVSLANSIISILSDRNILVDMGKYARKIAEERYRVEYVVKEHMEIYKNLLN